MSSACMWLMLDSMRSTFAVTSCISIALFPPFADGCAVEWPFAAGSTARRPEVCDGGRARVVLRPGGGDGLAVGGDVTLGEATPFVGEPLGTAEVTRGSPSWLSASVA